jgi:biotin-[acetyl-CoA-carboxylase] ligase BirA-like protein
LKYIKNEIKRTELKPKIMSWISPKNEEYLIKIPFSVYPPREDTDLLANTLMSFGSGRGRKILEIGCGSGVVSIFAETCGWKVVGCDINPLAIVASRGLAKERNITNVKFIEGGIEPKESKNSQIFEEGPYDLILWNLPYLKKPSIDELLGPLEDASLSDISKGKKGNLHQLLLKKIETEKCLKENGSIILIHNDEDTGRMLTSDCRKMGWASRSILQKVLKDGEKIHATALWKPWASIKKIQLKEVDSTNSYLLERTEPNGTLVVAKNQLKGRGQRDNSWIHLQGGWCGSWMIDLNNSSPATIQAKAGLAIIETIASVCSLELPTFDLLSMTKFLKTDVCIKWPNDLLIENKKFGGILSEAKTQGDNTKCVVGIGCNLSGDNNKISKIIPGATSLKKLFDSKINNKKWEEILHASMASKFQKHEFFDNPSESEEMINWWLSMEPFCKNNIVEIDSIEYNMSGVFPDGSAKLIPLEKNIGNQIKCEESFNLKWKQKLFN